jgi:hypothetical protein
MQLQTELKEIYERSLFFVTSVEMILADVHHAIEPEARVRVESMVTYLNHMKEALGLKLKGRDQSGSPVEMRSALARGRHSVSVTPTGKKILKMSVNESSKKLMQSRAGRSVFSSDIKEASLSPSRFASFESETTWTSDTQALPQYNLLTGKVERLERLPTFDEYIGTEVLSTPHTSTLKCFDKIKKTATKIEAFYVSMRRLAKHVKMHGGIPDTHSKFERQATKVSRLTHKSEVSKLPELAHRLPSVDSSHRHRLREASPVPLEAMLISRKKSFIRTRQAQDQDLSAILSRIDRDRSSVLKEKVRIVHKNSQQSYKDSLHTLSLFNDMRRVMERGRVNRRNRAVEQMKGYMKMCDYYRLIARKPRHIELQLMETVRLSLEEGLSVSFEEFEAILKVLEFDVKDEVLAKTANEFTKQLGLVGRRRVPSRGQGTGVE